MIGIDVPLLWHSFVAALSGLIDGIRKMSFWVYVLLFFIAALANVLAVLFRGGL